MCRGAAAGGAGEAEAGEAEAAGVADGGRGRADADAYAGADAGAHADADASQGARASLKSIGRGDVEPIVRRIEQQMQRAEAHAARTGWRAMTEKRGRCCAT